jgi:hypothetical protein
VGAEGLFDACKVDEREGCDVRVVVVPGAVDVVAAVVVIFVVLEIGEPIVLVIVAVSEGDWLDAPGSESSSLFTCC